MADRRGDEPREPKAGRLRRFMLAALVGAAVIVAPGGPSRGLEGGRPPLAYERVLRWRDIIRMRLGPWLASGMLGPSTGKPTGPATGGPLPSRWPTGPLDDPRLPDV